MTGLQRFILAVIPDKAASEFIYARKNHVGAKGTTQAVAKALVADAKEFGDASKIFLESIKDQFK